MPVTIVSPVDVDAEIPSDVVRGGDMQHISGLTGTGALQSIAHGLGYVPATCIIIPQGASIGQVLTLNSMTSTHINVTVHVALSFHLLVLGKQVT